MKKIGLLFALAASIVSHAQNNEVAQKVGYANMEYIIGQLPDMKAIDTDLKSTQAQFRKEIEARSQKLQKEYTDFNANAATMTDTLRENTQRQLQNSMAELEQYQQDAERTIQNKRKLFMAPVYLKVSRAIADVAKENGFGIILSQNISSYPFLLYNNTQVDVSPLVLQKLGVTPAAAK
jgi:outer membrane protein